MTRQPKAPLRSLFAVLLGGLLLAVAVVLAAAERPPKAAIASAHPLATTAGFEVLEAGGNAFDAAVAVSAVLAVVEPYSSGLGGGGFWLLHRAADGHEILLDGRERAPLGAGPDMYLGSDGGFVPERSLDGPLAAGIPGEPAALVHLAEHYGRLPLERTLRRAIRLARDGFPADGQYRRFAGWRLDLLRQWPAGAAQFLVDGEVPPEGALIRQPDLADTLERFAREGRDGFYAGPTAERLVAGVREAGGIWTLEDLAAYEVLERAPLVGRYRGWRVVSAGPPSSGGVLLVQMLNMLSGYELGDLSPADRAHLLVEIMRRSYRDRALYLGDPDFVEIPVERLTHPFYAAGLARDIRPDRATASVPASPRAEGEDTTHFSILDREGNRVAATLSINYPFGSGFVPPGTGVLLNDEMDDFSAQPGAPNAYGLVGGEANAIAPGKRMLSSMTPTFVESDRGVAVLGTPGGSRIITMVLGGVLALDAGQDPADWVAKSRFHHQYLPDEVQHEARAFTDADRRSLQAKGHRLREISDGFGNMQAIYWDRLQGRVRAASDPRGVGRAEVR
ncbi:MAG: gamma-glutamyltransferase [Pseudomonadota bacterium]|nr:gamma-glutamyltransferase [Pseudomonadota bacterium]